MPQKRLSGVAYLQADGTTLPAVGSFEVPLTTVVRENKVVGDQVLGYEETHIAPYVNATIQITDETDFEWLCSSTALTVRVEFANGRKYVLSDAFVQGTPTTSENGETAIVFAGKKGVWE